MQNHSKRLWSLPLNCNNLSPKIYLYWKCLKVMAIVADIFIWTIICMPYFLSTYYFFLTTFTIFLNEVPHDAQRVWLNTSQFFVCTSTYLCVDDFTYPDFWDFKSFPSRYFLLKAHYYCCKRNNSDILPKKWYFSTKLINIWILQKSYYLKCLSSSIFIVVI